MAEELVYPRVEAQHDYEARSDQELSFYKGDVMIITDVLDDAWLYGEVSHAQPVPQARVL